MKDMNCISLLEPWASCIAMRLKRVETRTRPLPQSYIGKPLAIQAAKRWGLEQRESAHDLVFPPGLGQGLFGKPPNPGLLPRDWRPQLGRVLCVCTPYACLRTTDRGIEDPDNTRAGCAAGSAEWDTPQERLLGDWSHGRYLWLLKDVRRIVPFAFTGRQGFFKVPDELIVYEKEEA